MDELLFKVIGMKCEGCLSKTRKALEGVEGVKEVDVDLETGNASVKGEGILENDVVSAVSSCGFAYLPR